MQAITIEDQNTLAPTNTHSVRCGQTTFDQNITKIIIITTQLVSFFAILSSFLPDLF